MAVTTRARDAAIVETRAGAIRGEVTGAVRAFKGIPYAAAPVGANRLQPPRAVEPWRGVRDAHSFGATPPQAAIPAMVAALIPNPTLGGDESLNLNVWAPDSAETDRPVMVWIHGGSFVFGTGAAYDGSRFARDGVVCVTLNYRVGADGFLLLDDGIANLGLLDQVAALEWVQANIAAFGGDPANVTVFGESAGAMSIGTLLAMPCAEGLFRRAILQSGSVGITLSAPDALRIGRIFAEQLGVAPTRSALAAVPPDRFLAAQLRVSADVLAQPDPERWGLQTVRSTLPWQPVVDGTVVPASPIDRIRAGSTARTDILIGTTADEWRLFLAVGGAIDRVTDEALAAAAAAYGLPAERALAAFRTVHPGASAGDLLAAVQSDWWVRIPALHVADAHATQPGTTYMYEFAWRTPQFDGRLGSCHGLDVPFVFDDLGSAAALVGANPPQQLAAAMHATWIAFAARGTCPWPPYDLERRATMRFDTACEVVDDPRALERALWSGVR